MLVEPLPKKDAPDKIKRKTKNQIREDTEDRDQTWTKIHVTKTWDDRNGWRSLCNSRTKRL